MVFEPYMVAKLQLGQLVDLDRNRIGGKHEFADGCSLISKIKTDLIGIYTFAFESLEDWHLSGFNRRTFHAMRL